MLLTAWRVTSSEQILWCFIPGTEVSAKNRGHLSFERGDNPGSGFATRPSFTPASAGGSCGRSPASPDHLGWQKTSTRAGRPVPDTYSAALLTASPTSAGSSIGPSAHQLNDRASVALSQRWWKNI
ncbi:MAG: hypothetical protein HKL84_08860 [Acidimicrobiaceae bacterium]|nr:hypothetical protein [Acidimicrobiaceae bacterium]